MRSRWIVAIALGLLAVQAGAGETDAPKSPKEKTSYAVGVDLARSVRQQGIEVDFEVMVKGLKDGMSGATLLMTDRELQAARTTTQNEVMRRQAAQRQQMGKSRKASADANRKAGEAFLAENGTKDGVVVLPSGLQYKVLQAGDGKKPAESDTVECRYRGTLIDGSMFGSSGRDGKSSTFRVADTIPGWREALTLMPAGSRWQIVVPPGLAYGERGAGQIGPNATLVFEVELVAVNPGRGAPARPAGGRGDL